MYSVYLSEFQYWVQVFQLIWVHCRHSGAGWHHTHFSHLSVPATLGGGVNSSGLKRKGHTSHKSWQDKEHTYKLPLEPHRGQGKARLNYTHMRSTHTHAYRHSHIARRLLPVQGDRDGRRSQSLTEERERGLSGSCWEGGGTGRRGEGGEIFITPKSESSVRAPLNSFMRSERNKQKRKRECVPFQRQHRK